MGAIDEFLDFENERKQKLAERRPAEPPIKYDPRVQIAAMKGGALGGGVLGAVRGGIRGAAAGGPQGAAIGALAEGGLGAAKGAVAGGIHESALALHSPFMGRYVLPGVIDIAGTGGGLIAAGRERHKIQQEEEAAAKAKKQKKKQAAIDPVMAAAAPMVGQQIAGQGFRQAFGSTLKGMGTLAGASLIVGAGMKGLDAIYDKASNAIGRARGYKAMVEANPGLKKMDRKRVEMAYNTLHKFNPEMAEDPLVASSFVNRVAEMGQVTTQDIGNLMAARDRARGDTAFTYGSRMAPGGLQVADLAEGERRRTGEFIRRQQALGPVQIGQDVARQQALMPGEITKAVATDKARARHELRMNRAKLRQGQSFEQPKAFAQQMGRFQAEQSTAASASSLLEQKAFAQETGKQRATANVGQAQKEQERQANLARARAAFR